MDVISGSFLFRTEFFLFLLFRSFLPPSVVSPDNNSRAFRTPEQLITALTLASSRKLSHRPPDFSPFCHSYPRLREIVSGGKQDSNNRGQDRYLSFSVLPERYSCNLYLEDSKSVLFSETIRADHSNGGHLVSAIFDVLISERRCCSDWLPLTRPPIHVNRLSD